MPAADDAIIRKIETAVLRPDVVMDAIEGAVRRLQPSEETVAARREQITTELRRLDEEQQRYIAAIAVAPDVVALAAEVAKREQRQQALARELDGLSRLAAIAAVGAHQIEADLRERLRDWRGLMARNTACARQILMRLLGREKIRWTPHPETREYEFQVRVTFGKVLRGLAITDLVVTTGRSSPTEFEPVFWP
jgi:hypothetical protein